MEKLKDEWQKRNINSQKLVYPKVTRSHIVSGLKPNNKFHQYNNYESRVFSTTAKTIAPSSLIISLLGLILLSFQFLTKEAELYDYLLFFGQIFLITLNVVLILSTLYSIFERTYLKATDERRTDIEKFHRRDKGGIESYSEKETKAYEVIEFQEKGFL